MKKSTAGYAPSQQHSQKGTAEVDPIKPPGTTGNDPQPRTEVNKKKSKANSVTAKQKQASVTKDQNA